MLAALLITIAIGGASASYFFSKFWPRTVLILSYGAMATGITSYIAASICISQTDEMLTHWSHIGPQPYTPGAWLAQWIDPFFLAFIAAMLAILGFVACLGFGFRKLKPWLGA